MFRRGYQLVLRVQDLELTAGGAPDRSGEDEAGPEPDAGELLTPEPLHDHSAAAVVHDRFDRAAALAGIDPDVLDHARDLAAGPRLDLGDRDHPFDRTGPLPQMLRSYLLRWSCKPFDQVAQESHGGQVWQYRPRRHSGAGGLENTVHVVIAGCGRVGSELATNLQRLGHSISVIDKNRKAFERLRADFAGKQIVGFAFDREVLNEAGIEDANAFASVTSGDNSNILSARVAKDHYRVPHVVARIYDPRRAQIYQRLGIQTVATVRWTTDQILRSLIPDEVPVEYTVDNGEVVVTALPAIRELVGKKAVAVDDPGLRRVVAVSRFGVPRIPDQDFTIQDGDIIYISAARSHLADMDEAIKKVGEPE